MPFKSAKRRSGQALSGSTGQSNTSRVNSAGQSRRMSSRKRGSESAEVPRLTQPVVSAILATTATVTMGTNRPGDGTIYWIADTNTTQPSTAQIKAGLEQGGGAADDDGSGAATDPFVASLTGLVTATLYAFFAYQEGSESDGPIATVQFTTA